MYERQKKAATGFADRGMPGGQIAPGNKSHATAKAIAERVGCMREKRRWRIGQNWKNLTGANCPR